MQQFRLEKGQYLRALALIAGDELAKSLGGDIRDMMPAVGLDPTVMRNLDQLISFRACIALQEMCAAHFDMPDFGLKCTTAMEPSHPNLGPVLALAHFAPTARDWFDDVMSYWAYHTNAFTFEIHEEVLPGLSIFREVNHLVGLKSRQYAEHVIANIVSVVRIGLNLPDRDPTIVRFRHNRPRSIATHEEFFRCPVEFGCEHDELVFATDIMQTRTQGNLAFLRPIMQRYVQSRIDRLEFYDAGVATNVALALTSLVGTGHADLAAVADTMGVSAKKLQRLLAAEGTSFSAVAESVREKMALGYLDQPEPPVGLVARLLGYSGNAAFTLAFRKWTGQSPMQWRKSRRRTD